MILFHCANGYAVFRVRPSRDADLLAFHCLNDGSDTILDRATDALFMDGLRRVAAKAIALQGAVVSIADFAELV